MKRQDKEAGALRRQIRYVTKVSGGRLELSGSRQALLREIGQFIERIGFSSREEGSRALGIKPTQYDYLIQSYRKLPRQKRRTADGSERKGVKLSPVRIVDAPVATSPRCVSRPINLVLESGVKITVESSEQAIELLERLEKTCRPKAAS